MNQSQIGQVYDYTCLSVWLILQNSQQHFGFCKLQYTAQLIHDNVIVLTYSITTLQNGLCRWRPFHQMQAHVPRQTLKNIHATYTMPMLINFRRKNHNSHLPRQYPDNSARYTTFGRNAHRRQPVTRRIIHATGHHHAEHLAHHITL